MIPHQYFPDLKMLKWDVSVPIDRISTFLERAAEAVNVEAPDAICYAAGHVGDGNVHNSAFRSKTLSVDDRIPAILDRIDQLIWELNGAIVAEHGVGALFRERVSHQKPAVEHEMLQTVKACFDPSGIMTPGKRLKPLG